MKGATLFLKPQDTMGARVKAGKMFFAETVEAAFIGGRSFAANHAPDDFFLRVSDLVQTVIGLEIVAAALVETKQAVLALKRMQAFFFAFSQTPAANFLMTKPVEGFGLGRAAQK